MDPTTRRWYRLAALGLLMAAGTLVACPRPTAIWLEGQEARGRPVFGIGQSRGGRATYLGALIVAPCQGDDGTARSAVWFVVSAESSDGPEVSRVAYGRIPEGYAVARYMEPPHSRTEVAPPLESGCYVARLEGTGQLRFEIGPDGAATELEEDAR